MVEEIDVVKISIPEYKEVEISESQFTFVLSISKQLLNLYAVRDGYRHQVERPGATENVEHKGIHYQIPYSILIAQIQKQIDHYERVLLKTAKIKIIGGKSDQ